MTEAPVGVEAVRRTVSDGSLLFLLNHGETSVEIPVSGEAVQLSGKSAFTGGRMHLEARDVAIVHQSAVASKTPAS